VDPLETAAEDLLDRRGLRPDQALMLAAAVCIDEISERERERNR
jgi:hypothetical protein